MAAAPLQRAGILGRKRTLSHLLSMAYVELAFLVDIAGLTIKGGNKGMPLPYSRFLSWQKERAFP